MKPRYNLRCASKASTNSDMPQDIYDNGIDDDGVDKNEAEDEDDHETLLARHHRRMLAEQKDRKIYERYVRDQRALRRLQCRKTHTAHLNETTRQRLLRGLQRERRHVLHDQIRAHVERRSIVFHHVDKAEHFQMIDWKVLEEDLLEHSKADAIHQLDTMINHLKRLMRTTKSVISRPRLSVRERQKQRLGKSHSSTSLLDFHLPLPIASLSPHIPLVRYIDHQQSQTSNAQHLTCIQNVLTSTQQPSPIALRKTLPRTRSLSSMSVDDASSSDKRPMEKENCHATAPPQENIVLRTRSPMVSLKQCISRTCAKTRRQMKHI